MEKINHLLEGIEKALMFVHQSGQRTTALSQLQRLRTLIGDMEGFSTMLKMQIEDRDRQIEELDTLLSLREVDDGEEE